MSDPCPPRNEGPTNPTPRCHLRNNATLSCAQHKDFPNRQKGGGVGFLLSPQSTFQVLPVPPSLSLSSFEMHCISLFSPISLRIAAIYRPPGPVLRFLDDFAAWLPYFLSSEIPTIILGDFNIPVNVNSPTTAKLLNLTSSFDLTQWTHTSTHSNGNTLDLVFSHLCNPGNLTNTPFPLTTTSLLSLYPCLQPPIPPSSKQLLVETFTTLTLLFSIPLLTTYMT